MSSACCRSWIGSGAPCWFACPDNITFDPAGRLWVATDGANDFDLPDSVYGVDTEGRARGLPKLLFTCPHDAEATGPCFTPDGTTLSFRSSIPPRIPKRSTRHSRCGPI
ncbi:alkaline phosphatase PhoX [Mesorhizobium huakuii]|uniref:alkaline phosphatase PhoX n=1 Tax=Mesorhizobium huakuii TaxID=28104 RepID=UPI002ADDEF35|nr:alkaline phosphatase PhoX [Mesorhizobium huakuii]